MWAARDLSRHITVDARLSAHELLTLARSFIAAPITERDVATLPSAPLVGADDIVSPFPPLHVGAVSHLMPLQPAADRAIAEFAGSSP